MLQSHNYLLPFIKREISDAVYAGSQLALISAAGAVGIMMSFVIIPVAILYGLGIPIARTLDWGRGRAFNRTSLT